MDASHSPRPEALSAPTAVPARCTKCGFLNATAARFCEQCGTNLSCTCPSCGQRLSAGARYCSACGAPLDGLPPPVRYTPRYLTERILAEQSAFDARSAASGERKTVTVMFADLVDSTALIHGMDPEESHRLITPVLDLMMESVHHYEGYVAKLLGDGILALFGAPIAHENHPLRALYAALAMQDAMRRHSERVRSERGLSMAIRIGVHAGEVVIRSIRKDDLRVEYDPVGGVIHIASRMQTIAAPSSTLVSEAVRKLADGYFEFRPIGTTQVKGVTEPLAIHELAGVGPIRTRLQVATRRGLTAFTGRETELAHMNSALVGAGSGQGRIVSVVGDAGVGKSRLFHEFKERWRNGCLLLEASAMPHGKAFPYLPLIELLKHYFQLGPHDDQTHCRDKVRSRVLALGCVADDVVPYVCGLLGIDGFAPALAEMDSRIRRMRTFEAVTTVLIRESVNQPVVLLFDDLQWLDGETEGFIAFLAQRIESARILLLSNYRPEYRNGAEYRANCTELHLEPLGRPAARTLLTDLLGSDAALAPLKQLILEQTDGNPFFMEEAVQTLIEEQVLTGERGAFRVNRMPDTLRIPATVQDVLAARMDRLPAVQKMLLQTLAVVGRSFPWSLALAVCRGLVAEDADELRDLLSRLQAADFIHERPAFPEIEYVFKHALTQDVADHALLAEQRCMLHERTARAIEALHPTRREEHYSDLAHHYRLSGNIPKAVEYLRHAGKQALQRGTQTDAIGHLRGALELLGRMPDTPERSRDELALHITLGPALMGTRGWAAPDVHANYVRALDLSEQLGDTRQRFAAQLALRTYHALRAEYAVARDLGERLLELANSENDIAIAVEAHSALGSGLFFQGEFDAARDHLEQALARYQSTQRPERAYVHGLETGVRCLTFSSWTLWYLGYPEQASQRAEAALAHAHKLSHPFNLTFTLVSLAQLHQFRGDVKSAQECAEAAIDVATRHGFTFNQAWATVLRGWVLADQGKRDEGITQIETGLAAYRSTGAELGCSNYLALLASAYDAAGRVQDAQSVIGKALSMVHATGERFYESELHRLDGRQTLRASAMDATGAAEACFHRAVAVANAQHAKSMELRATLDLARLWQRQGRAPEARDRLKKILGAFTEGFATAELMQARTIVGEVSP
ncbi:adenylate/guanylate cyclase [Caballeronia peredens]|nr:adenylate/guanylate cyclase [Caballeronia peredens]